MNISEERTKILSLYDKYQNQQGKSNILNDGKPYERHKEISRELNGKWGGKRQITYLHKILTNDTEDLFYTFGLLNYSWRLSTILNFHTKGLYSLDVNNDNIFIPQVFDGKLRHLPDIIKKITHYYNVINDSYIYILGIEDNNVIFPVKKIGFTTDLKNRIKYIDALNGYNIVILALWEVQQGKESYVESQLHRKFNYLNKKYEWFNDPDGNLIEMVREEINTISDIKINEVIPHHTHNTSSPHLHI